MNHTTLGMIFAVISVIMAASLVSTMPAVHAVTKSKDNSPMQKNEQHLFQSGRDNLATNIATNVICVSPGPCIVE